MIIPPNNPMPVGPAAERSRLELCVRDTGGHDTEQDEDDTDTLVLTLSRSTTFSLSRTSLPKGPRRVVKEL